MILKIAVSAAETRSFARAAQVMQQVGDVEVSAKTIQRVTLDVGQELVGRREASAKSDEALAQRPEAPPELAIVQCDGGRIRTREPGQVTDEPQQVHIGHGRAKYLIALLQTDLSEQLLAARRKSAHANPPPAPPQIADRALESVRQSLGHPVAAGTNARSAK